MIKKLVITMLLVFSMSLLLQGCFLKNLVTQPCTPAGADALTQAKDIRTQIQNYYGPLQELATAIPTVGPIVAAAVPIALSAADQALNALGKMIASGCAVDANFTLAQIALNQIKNLFAMPEVKMAMAKRGIKAPK